MSLASSNARQLIIVPIIHTRTDLGTLAEEFDALKRKMLSDQELLRSSATIADFWNRIEHWSAGLSTDNTPLRIYQDALPVCGREHEIVTDLAERGSPNFLIIKQLVNRGGMLMGTESPDLLLEEYRQIIGQRQQSDPQPNSLLRERRDKFIAERINQTLQINELGILFLGILHSITPWLANDIECSILLDDLFAESGTSTPSNSQVQTLLSTNIAP